ncbi:putative cytochrome P450 hydroxylase [Cystobacter fuscus DSM 2262]|uniref:Cytochrome P450 hydroxylase n=1 Tax=Cystobacter fuscus (strain ATCC 25194 / DSM 2262 / NBRC 100088 / M29) TaxID=1242864 RepID=S9QJK5_CYSF2|nr:cytochrome P450 [Cystobacter fuscus]EPX56638.1 putative cytochrome P450 hydroxylase [Cystobacter fuscus DSM 2262]
MPPAVMPWSPEHLRDPYPFYASLRESAPVLQVEPFGGAYVITRYDDITSVLKNPGIFSSQRVAPVVSLTAESGEKARGYFGNSKNLISADPPEHTRLRALVGRAFTPRRVAELEPWMRSLTRELLDRMLAREEFDLMKELAVPLPVTVISELLGVEPERREDFKRWSDDVMKTIAMAVGTHDPAPILASLQQFHAYLERIIEQRRREPREDLISALLEESEGYLEVPDLISFTRVLLVAGNETTANLLGNTMVALLRHPRELERLLEDPSLIASVVEEALRYDGPLQALVRVTAEDTQVAGHRIPEGARVMLLLACANRDPRRFVEPDRFDITRDNPSSLSFGHGVHFCLGAPLARLEAKVVLEELVSRVRHVSFAPGQEQRLDWGDSLQLRGPRALRLRAERRPAP